MRISCNGCRILRKGCSDDCIIKPCLDWIKSPDSQANATLFLAKFYGRAGLINLIEAGPLHHRHAIFKSLLYEACGRVVDPISGSVGLLWSGKWEACQAAVDSVLKGAPIAQNPSSSSSLSSTNSSINAPPSLALNHHPSPPPPPHLKIYDIRHVSRDHSGSDNKTKAKTKTSRLKRSWNRRPKAPLACTNHHHNQSTGKFHPPGQFSGSLSQLSREDESIFSVETVEGSLANRTKPRWCSQNENCEVGLELTLGLSPDSEQTNRLISALYN